MTQILFFSLNKNQLFGIFFWVLFLLIFFFSQFHLISSQLYCTFLWMLFEMSESLSSGLLMCLPMAFGPWCLDIEREVMLIT